MCDCPEIPRDIRRRMKSRIISNTMPKGSHSPCGPANPHCVAGRRVTVIGDGTTGRQISLELATAGIDVTLSMGRRRNFGPQRIFGKDASSWALDLGFLTADKATLRGRFVRALDVTPGLYMRPRELLRAGIRLTPRCVDAAGSRLVFADGSSHECDTVIFTLGYRHEADWMEIGGAAVESEFLETRGVSPVPGIYFVGREWQNCRASALLCGVHRDAAIIASHVKRFLTGRCRSMRQHGSMRPI